MAMAEHVLHRGWTRWLPLLVVFGVSVTLVLRLFQLVSQFSVNIFFWDQWDFNNASLFEPHTLWGMFSWQHGPHRQGLGPIVQYLVEPQFGWNSRAEAFLAGTIVALAATCALILKKRLCGRISYWDVVIPLIFLTPAQYESLWVIPNLSHGPLPLLLIVLYCFAWTCRSLALKYCLALVINFVAIFTGFGLFIGFVTPLLLVLDHLTGPGGAPVRRWVFAVSLLISLVSLCLFFRGYLHQSAADCFAVRSEPLLGYGAFVSLMLAHFSGARGTGAIPLLVGGALFAGMTTSALLALRKILATRAEEKGLYLASLALISFCLLFCAGTAYGRLCLGLEAALSSRYTNYVTLGILGLYLAIQTLGGPVARTSLVAVLVALSAIGSLPVRPGDREEMQLAHDGKRAWRECCLGDQSIEQCDHQTGFRVYPWPMKTHLKEKLSFLKRTKLNLYSEVP